MTQWHVSGPDCADSFTGSCQYNEPSEASNEAIIVCGRNNQSTVNSVVRILRRQRVDDRLAAVKSKRVTWSLIGDEVHMIWEIPHPSTNRHKENNSCNKTTAPRTNPCCPQKCCHEILKKTPLPTFWDALLHKALFTPVRSLYRSYQSVLHPSHLILESQRAVLREMSHRRQWLWYSYFHCSVVVLYMYYF